MKNPPKTQVKKVRKAKRAATPKSYLVLLTKLVGRKQPWCPEDWFVPTFDGGEAIGWVTISDPAKAVPGEALGLPLTPSLLAKLHDRLASWEELYPDATWRYELIIVGSGKALRFPLAAEALR